MHRAILLSIALTCLVAACTLAPEPAPPPLAPGLARQTQTIEGLRLLLDHPDDAQTLQEQRMQIWLQDGRGHPVSGAEVRLDLAMPMLCASGDAPAATEIAPGSYEATTTYVMSGSWTVTVSVLRDGARSAASFPVQVREDPTQALINPYAADLAAAELGAQIYAGSCASCHGDGGRGDGPAAAGLQPPPADLSAHLAPGKHSDGEIFRWIRDGIAGSAMPAFGATLSEEQRWQLISFLRTMPGAAPAEVSGPLPPAILIRAGNLYRSDGSGQPPQPVSGTSALGSFSGLALAPDGRQLAVIARRPSTVTETGRLVVPVLYSMNPDGSEPRPLWEALDQELAHPAWTPDGAAVVVTAQAFTPIGDGGGYLDIPTLVRVELATGARTTLATNAQSPALSPDGTLLAFTQRDEVTNEIRLMLA
jgi:mono/diheme cytochrome c family protein